jgi:DNA-binding beta-propeller fold protein YncE
MRLSTKLMAAGVALSLGWILLAACECDEPEEGTKEAVFPGYWVACVGNQPVLLSFFGNQVVTASEPTSIFNPDDWDCTHPNSPAYKKSSTPAWPAGTPYGPPPPSGSARPRVTGSPQAAYLAQRLHTLPFTPYVPPPGALPACDSTFPDVLQTDHNEALVTRISTCPFKIVATIPVVTRPLQVDITPDGSTALVTSFDNALNFIDLTSNKVTFTLMTDLSINPNGLAISPDGTTAYITSFNTDNPVVLVINIASKSIVATIPTISYAQGATLTPDGSELWITSPLSTETDVIDTLTNTTTYRLNLGVTTDVAFNSTGTTAYITTASVSPGQVVAVDTATFQTKTTYNVGQGPTDIQMAYGDRFLVVNNNLDNSISIIDLLKGAVATTTVSGTPSGISFVH